MTQTQWGTDPTQRGGQQYAQTPFGYPQAPTASYGRSPYGQQYPVPGGFPQRPPRKPSKSPLIIVLVGLMIASVLVLTTVTLSSRLPVPKAAPSATSTGYQNDNYTAPDIDSNPPYLPSPASGQVNDWLNANTLYLQRPLTNVRCDLEPVDPSAGADVQQLAMNTFITCLMKVWSVPVTDAGFILPRSSVTVYSRPIQTPCGVEETHNAFYCMSNQQFYYATDLAEVLPPALHSKPWIIEVVLAHEFGHAVQGRAGILSARNHLLMRTISPADLLLLSRRAEAQADCFSGVFLQAIARNENFDEATIESFKQTYYNFGDDILSGKPGIVADHGSGATRQAWGMKGLKSGANNTTLDVCNSWTADNNEVS